MKETAIEFLVDNLHYLHSTKWDDIIEEAKEMEKQQIIDAHIYGFYSRPFGKSRNGEAEQYYNETFKSE